MPIARLEVPANISPDAKRTMMNKIARAIDEAYDGIATRHGEPILVFFYGETPDNIAVLSPDYAGLYSENPKYIESLKQEKSS